MTTKSGINPMGMTISELVGIINLLATEVAEHRSISSDLVSTIVSDAQKTIRERNHKKGQHDAEP